MYHYKKLLELFDIEKTAAGSGEDICLLMSALFFPGPGLAGSVGPPTYSWTSAAPSYLLLGGSLGLPSPFRGVT